jgi:hypothetical protein
VDETTEAGRIADPAVRQRSFSFASAALFVGSFRSVLSAVGGEFGVARVAGVSAST